MKFTEHLCVNEGPMLAFDLWDTEPGHQELNHLVASEKKFVEEDDVAPAARHMMWQEPYDVYFTVDDWVTK